MRHVLVWLAALAAVAPAAAENGPVNLDFEAPYLLSATEGWLCPTAGYRAEISRERPQQGAACALLSSLDNHDLSPFGNLMQTWDATPYRGQRIKVRAAVRTELAAGQNGAKLWLRIDLNGDRIGFLDNMGRRQINNRDWKYYELVADVPQDARAINFGLMLITQGRAWLDDVTITGAAAPISTPRSTDAQALENLAAFAKLLAYVRFFHPSDEAAGTDWDAFAVQGVPRVEVARDDAALAAVLQELFHPIAPTVAVWAGGAEPPLDPPLTPADREALSLTRWQHFGVGLGGSQSIYRSTREFAAARATPADYADPARPFRAALTGGVQCRIPLSLFANENGTLPRGGGSSATSAASSPNSGDDRTTRLAAVALTWGVLQHFYPYFDVIDTDWSAALREALAAAAMDANGRAFLDTLRRLTARLQDGHANVWHPAYAAVFTLPLTWAWVGEELVVTHVDPKAVGGPAVGEVVVSIDGRSVRELRGAASGLISAPTQGWLERRLMEDLARAEAAGVTKLELRGSSGVRTVEVQRVAPQTPLREPRPEAVAEVRPGVMYVDLDRITDKDFGDALSRLEAAKGIVFDLRGYPARLSIVVLQHLMREAGTCAQWHVPSVTRPDREGMTFQFSNWPVTPLGPRLTAKAAFVTDGGAISYAETYLGIVEAYKLGEIVGQQTAGTNGNVNSFEVPGGYQIAFTGMKVLKHDGSRHHGIGIRPTIPAARTLAGIAAGKDELLERAIEVVGGGVGR